MSLSPSTEETCDLLVIGSGAGGLSTAVTAARLGLDVLLIEKEAQFGGTTAGSGGWMWIPRNPLAVESGLREDIEAPRHTYAASSATATTMRLSRRSWSKGRGWWTSSGARRASLSSTADPVRTPRPRTWYGPWRPIGLRCSVRWARARFQDQGLEAGTARDRPFEWASRPAMICANSRRDPKPALIHLRCQADNSAFR